MLGWQHPIVYGLDVLGICVPDDFPPASSVFHNLMIVNGHFTILKGVKEGCILKDSIDGAEFWCLYFGISKDLRQRIRWHIMQHRSNSAVRSGFLSTLRKALSALLGIKQLKSENSVNDILDKCYWDWVPTASIADAESIETDQLSKGYFPLNVQKNIGVGPELVKQLKHLRNYYKR